MAATLGEESVFAPAMAVDGHRRNARRATYWMTEGNVRPSQLRTVQLAYLGGNKLLVQTKVGHCGVDRFIGVSKSQEQPDQTSFCA